MTRYLDDDPESCHCGRPVSFGFDGNPQHHRGMCAHCDSVRCDAYPGACRSLRVWAGGVAEPLLWEGDQA